MLYLLSHRHDDHHHDHHDHHDDHGGLHRDLTATGSAMGRSVPSGLVASLTMAV
jgi:hypothetical protein